MGVYPPSRPSRRDLQNNSRTSTEWPREARGAQVRRRRGGDSSRPLAACRKHLRPPIRKAYMISSDPGEDAERVRPIEQMGATIVCLQNASGADRVGAWTSPASLSCRH
jgi:hypothetical protein